MLLVAWIAAATWGMPTEGLAPIDVGAPHDSVSSVRCAACHPRQDAEWRESRHRVSATNAIFVDGFASEPHPRCANCHAPEREQSASLLALAPRVVRTRALSIGAASSLHDGVSCAACHVRGGEIFAADPQAVPYGHPLRTARELREPAFCGSCHDFHAHETINGKDVVVDVPMQSTFAEWQRYRDAGGQGTCQSCHMPQARHTFTGAHTVDELRRSLQVTVVGRVVRLRSVGVGHSLPSGDLFRHIIVWADMESGRVQLARFGRRYRTTVDGAGGSHKALVEDTSLQPGTSVDVRVPRGAQRVVVTYHYADDATELAGNLPLDDIVATLADVPL